VWTWSGVLLLLRCCTDGVLTAEEVDERLGCLGSVRHGGLVVWWLRKRKEGR
jgi:hypothetical protein